MDTIELSPREKIEQLYQTSKRVDLKRGGQVWLRKMTVIQDREATRESLKVRANYEIIKKADKLDPDRLGIREIVETLGDARDLATFILGDEHAKLEASVRSKMSYEDKWSKNNYLDTLQEAWLGGMKDRFDRDADDQEARKIFEVLLEFEQEVAEQLLIEFSDLVEAKLDLPEETLIEECVDRLLDFQAIYAQAEEFNYWKIYFAAFNDAEFKTKLWDTIDAVKNAPGDLIKELIEEYEDMSVGVVGGKD